MGTFLKDREQEAMYYPLPGKERRPRELRTGAYKRDPEEMGEGSAVSATGYAGQQRFKFNYHAFHFENLSFKYMLVEIICKIQR